MIIIGIDGKPKTFDYPQQVRGMVYFHQKMYKIFKRTNQRENARQARQKMITSYLEYRKIR